ncbi:MAG: hypothetical protein A2Y33_01530 [Spirochaetes bacterium GWF1_51_8]|nr:MAG: hypothetical protein A2Y33_01530 [Spirochaetes bacterium GWF1_51_8]
MRFLIAAVFLFALHPSLHAEVFSANALVELAYSNNLNLKQTSLMVDAMKADIGAKNMWSDLMLMYSVQYISPADPGKLQHMISVEQMFPLWGKNGALEDAAGMDYLASKLQLEMEKRKIRKLVLSLVLDYSAVIEQAKIETDKLLMLDKLKSILKTEYATGKGMIAGIVDVEIRIAAVQFTLIELSNRMAIIGNTLIDILDLPYMNLVIAPPVLDFNKIGLDPQKHLSIAQTAASNSPEVQIAETQIKKYSDMIALSIAEFYPDLGVGASYMYTPAMQEHMFSVNLSFNLPVFSYGKKQGMTDFYVSKKAEAETMKAAMKDAVMKETERMLLKIKSLTAQVLLLKGQILKLSENNISSMLSAYQVQKAGFSELLSSILMFYQMRTEYIMTERMLFEEVLELEVMTGNRYYEF